MHERDINEAIVLGCGESINDLSEEELDHINRCKVVLAVNKFAAYYKKAGIIPTHVYYVDDHENSNFFLQYMFDVLLKDGLSNLHFILNKRFIHNNSTSRLVLYFKWIPLKILQGFQRVFIMKFNTPRAWLFAPLRFLKGFFIKTWLFRVPPSCAFTYVKPNYEGNIWAKSFDEPVYHFRGSLTSAMNCISILAPGIPVKLVGTDFYGSRYFFEEALADLSFSCDGWPTEMAKKEDKHYSAIAIDNETMFDRFYEVMSGLKETGNTLCVCNPRSLLVVEANVPCCNVCDKTD